MSEQNSPAKPDKTLSGVAFLVIGLIILVPSGLCTALFGGGALVEMLANPGNSDALSILPMALIFGGPFVVLGGFLVRAGIRNLRGK